MGWAVLYIAFGVVALWLLGEVLLQYKARLRWRLLAFAGFLCVVLGVLLPSVIVIALGAVAFAVGQTFVTLSFRRGFTAGWAVRHPGTGGERPKRRRARGDRAAAAPEPAAPADDAGDTVGVADTVAGHEDTREQPHIPAPAPDYGFEDDDDRDDVFTPVDRTAAQTAAESTAVYQPQPLPDDTGHYGVYDSGYSTTDQTQAPYAGTAHTEQSYGYDYSGYDGAAHGYGTTGPQDYTGYTEPYPGAAAYGGTSYDPGYGQQQPSYAAQDPYAHGGHAGETPAEGVWVPQQRTDESYGDQVPPEQPYPYPGTHGGQAQHGAGYDEQYRY
ncbi:hypothetical protein ACPCJU_01215 [Streptomyces thermodiastaticus]|uniref:SCO2102 family sporulation regulator n=1 Tax=Streptomyces thermoviolaceus TaxID=1952 RepID=UPI0033BF2230